MKISPRFLGYVLLSALLVAGVPSAAKASTGPQQRARHPLTTAIQLRRMSSTEAARSIPVHLKGLVTDFSGYRNSFFFQDATGGVSVDRTDNAEVHNGDQVEITGATSPGLFAPVLLASRVVVVGHSSPPKPVRVNYGSLLGGAQDSEWVEMEGVVHSAAVTVIDDHPVLVLHLDIGGGLVHVLLQQFSGVDPSRLVDATLRLRGVCATDFNGKRQFVGVELYVPSPRYLDILEPASVDPFAVPLTPVVNVLQFGQAKHRVKVSGISTLQLSGHSFYIQDSQGGIKVESLSTKTVAPGRRIEAVGFPASEDYAPHLADAIWRDLDAAPPVIPPLIRAAQVISQEGDFFHTPHDQQIVRMEGVLVESHTQGVQSILILRDGSDVFEATMPVDRGGRDRQIANGSLVRLTGICAVHGDADHNPVSFELLLESTAGVLVLKRASWWTSKHAGMVLGLFASGMALAALWVVVLRHRVRQQTRVIRESEERFRDLAQRDYLTGLPNRLMLEQRITECLARCDALNLKAAIVTVDVDHFKKINDTYGHLLGDEGLKIVAKRLRSVVREDDVIARTGGEEFTLMIGCLPDRETATRIAASVLAPFQQPVTIADCRLDLTVSVGLALYPDDSTDSIVLRRLSDEALYSAKRAGRNRAVSADPELCRVAGREAPSVLPSSAV